MKKLFVALFVLCFCFPFYSQHMPLKIGNQWHYSPYLGFFYQVAIATDTVRINDIKYFRIDAYNMGSPFNTHYYDRMEGDSLYFRLYPNGDTLLFNFNWTDGQIISTPGPDSCVNLRLIYRNVSTYLGVSANTYDSYVGSHCPGMTDTAWTISSEGYSSFFGGLYTYSGGILIGAFIDGTSYGTLYPVPVELLSFTSSIVSNDVTLNWTTATETNNRGFEVERQASSLPDGEAGRQSAIGNIQWEKIGFVDGYGTTTETKSYSYRDENLPAGKYQYRLKQIDFDGSFEYSNIVEVEIISPSEFSLEQNYPNPFNPTTKIKYIIPSVETLLNTQSRANATSVPVTLKVYDILGNEVATLVDEERPAGYYEVEFDASHLSSGSYIYKLTAGSFTDSKKMTLIK